jgi:hypothetical protein
VPSRTAETLLIRRDGKNALFLNPLKFNQDGALNFRIPLSDQRIPAAKVISGQRGIVEGLDYRNVPVIADIRAIPDSPWFIVARVDKEEIYGSIWQTRWLSIFLITSLLTGAGMGIGMIWRQQRFKFYKERVSDIRSVNLIVCTHSSVKSIRRSFVSGILRS